MAATWRRGVWALACGGLLLSSAALAADIGGFYADQQKARASRFDGLARLGRAQDAVGEPVPFTWQAAAVANELLPPAVTARMGGQNLEIQTSFRSLYLAIGLAVFLVYWFPQIVMWLPGNM